MLVLTPGVQPYATQAPDRRLVVVRMHANSVDVHGTARRKVATMLPVLGQVVGEQAAFVVGEWAGSIINLKWEKL